jgi:6-phosphogluconolactonase (cycloisomerase 2 family)
MKFRFLAGVMVSLALGILLACTTSNNQKPSQPGFLFVTTAGNASISSFSINLSSGALTAVGSPVATGGTPTAVAITPDGGVAFVVDGSAGTVTGFTVNSDGTLKASSSSVNTGANPTHIAIDSGGKFVFVANEGTFVDRTSGTISVFAINGTGLTQVSGSPFPVAAANSTGNGLGPGGLVVTPDGKFLYVANRFDDTIYSFSIGSTGTLTLLNPGAPGYSTGAAPVGLAITPDGGFLYVAVSGANSIAGFAICNQIVLNCKNPNAGPDGSLNPTSTPTVSAAVEPVALAITPDQKYLYAVNRTSSQVSEFSISSGTGNLTVLTSPNISTGTNPVSIAVRAGTTVTSTSNTIDYVYVANETSGTISIFSLDTATGVLGIVSQAFSAPSGQPTAVATE